MHSTLDSSCKSTLGSKFADDPEGDDGPFNVANRSFVRCKTELILYGVSEEGIA